MKYLSCITAFFLAGFSIPVFSSCGDFSEGMDCGVKVYQERCALCHGSVGLGEGLLALALKDYPDTSLLKKQSTVSATRDGIKEAILYGGSKGKLSAEMPPWTDELTVSEVNSVTELVYSLVTDSDKTIELLQSRQQAVKPSKRLGRMLYSGRCVLCHGKFADGKGKMARIIKNPPPFNLTQSRAPDEYLFSIIKKGGEKMGRSPRMPPWGSDLNDNEINSVIIYLKSIRTEN